MLWLFLIAVGFIANLILFICSEKIINKVEACIGFGFMFLTIGLKTGIIK